MEKSPLAIVPLPDAKDAVAEAVDDNPIAVEFSPLAFVKLPDAKD